ncbi:MAG: VWA domain-containing protein [Spirochaetales bacterium]|nr:VWA domain-containing protein [Spirochaetales bacterium]
MKRTVIYFFLFLSIIVIFSFFSCATTVQNKDESGEEPFSADKKEKEESETKDSDEEWSKGIIEDTVSGFEDSEELDPMDDSMKRGDDGKTGKDRIPSTSGLRAGYADDNKQFNYFINFLTTYNYVSHFGINIRERIIFKIMDNKGKSIPNAEVTIFGNGSTLCKGQSYADGSFLFFPSEYGTLEYFDVEVNLIHYNRASTNVEERYQQRKKSVRVFRDGVRQVDIVFDNPGPDMKNVPLDILFILDTTGSMGEEINRLKTTIEIINMNIVSLSSKPRVRFGMVLYKDRGDEEYITKIIPLTGNLDEFREELDQVEADGGGDVREDLQAALDDAIQHIEWNSRGIRLGFIITDAPPHLDYNQEYSYVDAVHDARDKGIKLFTVGTGGLSVEGEYVLRQISQYTYAKYIFLTYGEQGESAGGGTGSVSHHTGANFQTDKLEAIIIRFTKEELSYLTGQPMEEGEEYFEATRIEEEEKEETLNKLFEMAVSQLVDYSSIGLEKGIRISVIPVISSDEKYKIDAEYFTDQLVKTVSADERFTMVEREDLQKILEEMELQLSGIISDESAVEVGALLGAEVLITGKMYRKEKHYEIFFKFLRVETAEILSVTRTRIEKTLGLSK